jgi:hypothetical protein
VFNDWEMSARLLQAGYRVARTNLVTFEHRMRAMSGGAADIYTVAGSVRAAAEDLVARYPEAARVVWVEGHDLHEVRFRWSRLTARESYGLPGED